MNPGKLLFLCLPSLLLGAQFAQANCEDVYSKKLSSVFYGNISDDESESLGGGSLALVSTDMFVATGVGTPAIVAVPVAAGLSASSGYYVSHRGKEVEKTLSTIEDANSGDGVMIRQLAEDAHISEADAVIAVRNANANNALCKDGDVLSYGELVDYIAKGER